MIAPQRQDDKCSYGEMNAWRSLIIFFVCAVATIVILAGYSIMHFALYNSGTGGGATLANYALAALMRDDLYNKLHTTQSFILQCSGVVQSFDKQLSDADVSFQAEHSKRINTEIELTSIRKQLRETSFNLDAVIQQRVKIELLAHSLEHRIQVSRITGQFNGVIPNTNMLRVGSTPIHIRGIDKFRSELSHEIDHAIYTVCGGSDLVCTDGNTNGSSYQCQGNHQTAGQFDLALVLIANGYVMASRNAPLIYQQNQENAKNNRRGIWDNG